MRNKYCPPQHKITVIIPPGLYCYNTVPKNRCKFLSTFADVQMGMMEYHCTYYNVIWICLNGVPIKHNKCIGYFDYGIREYDYTFNTNLMEQGYNGIKQNTTELSIANDKIKDLEKQLNKDGTK